MEDTCRGKECWLYLMNKDLRGGEPDVKDCPFYVEMIYTPTSVGTLSQGAKLVKDCSNKRSLQWLMEAVHPRLMGLQAANEQARNRTHELIDVFIRGFNQVKADVQIEQKEEPKQLPQ
jgi:hypothetical protein